MSPSHRPRAFGGRLGWYAEQAVVRMDGSTRTNTEKLVTCGHGRPWRACDACRRWGFRDWSTPDVNVALPTRKQMRSSAKGSGARPKDGRSLLSFENSFDVPHWRRASHHGARVRSGDKTRERGARSARKEPGRSGIAPLRQREWRMLERVGDVWHMAPSPPLLLRFGKALRLSGQGYLRGESSWGELRDHNSSRCSIE